MGEASGPIAAGILLALFGTLYASFHAAYLASFTIMAFVNVIMVVFFALTVKDPAKKT